MASVLPLRSAATGAVSYRVRFRIGATQKQESFQDDRSAFEFKRLVETVGGAAALRVLSARATSGSAVPTVRAWTAQYLDQDSGLLTGIEPGTRAGYRRAAERSFLPFLGDLPVDAVQKDDVGRWLAWQEAQPSTQRKDSLVAAKTVRNYHAILSSVFASAVSKGYRSDNPAYKTRLTAGVRREGVFLSPEEYATLLHFIPQKHEALVMFLAYSGCRWGEATGLTWDRVNGDAALPTVRIDRAWKKGDGAPVLKQPKSAKSRRTVSIPPDVIAALGTPGPADQFVFRGELSGGHLWYGRFRTSTWEPAVRKAMDADLCEREGLTPLRVAPRIHDLRHSHASWLIAAGTPLTYVQQRLGHENITTTVAVYGHLQPQAHSEMSSAIAQTLSGTRPLRQLTAV